MEDQNEDVLEPEELDLDKEEAWDDLEDAELSEVDFDEEEF